MKRLLLILLLVCGGVNAAAPIAEIQSMLSRPDILCGRFDQTRQLTGMRKPLASNGRFCVVAGKGVLWRTVQPFPSTLRLTRDEIVHFQGGRVAMRLDARQEPTVRGINSVLFALLAGDLSQLDSLFVVEGSADAGRWQVALTAREPALAKAIGAITLDGAASVQHITLVDGSGDQTRIVFSAIQTGAGALQADEAALF